MKVFMIIVLWLLVPCSICYSATVNINCTATVQSIGACGVGDNAEAGVLIAYWASLTDDAPGDSEINSNAIDLRDAICAAYGITTCTKESADGALRKYLEGLVKAYRNNKKVIAIPVQSNPIIDAQGNQ